MKRITALLLAAFLLLALAACTDEKKTADATADATAGTSGEPAEETGETGTGTGFMQIPNPWSEAETLAEAAEKAKVGTFLAPVVAGGTGTQIFRWMDGLAETQVLYADGARLVVRKGVKTESGDISGDYNVYAARWTETVDGKTVACAGAAEGSVSLATWTAAYDSSISCDGMTLTLEELRSFVTGIR